jgi:hypothetical protein
LSSSRQVRKLDWDSQLSAASAEIDLTSSIAGYYSLGVNQNHSDTKKIDEMPQRA